MSSGAAQHAGQQQQQSFQRHIVIAVEDAEVTLVTAGHDDLDLGLPAMTISTWELLRSC